MISDYELLHAMHSTMAPLTAGRGSHTRVCSLDSERLGDVLSDLAGEHGCDKEQRSMARETGRRIGRRFLVKVGNIKEYVVKLSGGRESIISRPIMSEAFGPAGYNLAPTTEKVHTDSREAVREIPYLAFGPPEEQFAPDILMEARNAVSGRDVARSSSVDGTFLVEEDGNRRLTTDVYKILADDPYFSEDIRNFRVLARFQRQLRGIPIDSASRERLQPFFDAPMTVGIRDILRWAMGSRHPDIGWDVAEKVVRVCFSDYGNENFLPPEINYYTNSIEQSPSETAASMRSNLKAAEAFAVQLVEKLPLSWTMSRSDSDLRELASAILKLHFDYPLYEVEPYSGIVSSAGLRLALRVVVGLTEHLVGLELPERRNPLTPILAGAVRPISAFLDSLTGDDRHEFITIVNEMLWEMAIRGGVPLRDGGTVPFLRIERTFYSFQERAQSPVEAMGTVEEVLTLEDLFEAPGQRFIESNPEIARKLVVFFTLIYRYFLDTGHVPDLRPDDAGLDLFIRGIWGYKTKNVLVVSGKTHDGRPVNTIRFVDNKDQFKQYKRSEDRANPLGLAKYALRLVHPLIQPAMERSIGKYTGFVADIDGVGSVTRHDTERASRIINQVLRDAVDGTLTHSSAFLHDLIDDTTDGIAKLLKRF